jgi:hypothetical protein
VKKHKCQADLSPLSNGEIKNAGALCPFPSYTFTVSLNSKAAHFGFVENDI